jgi:hypothetical protein
MSAKPDYVSKLTRPTGAAATGGFVINLTSSTTPMALSQPKDPTLAQYTFFVSRRLEDGRERFRLHMGYFETLQAAEEMLVVVREVYPQAWAGEAPGKKLRANNDAAKSAAPAAPAPRAPAAVAAAPARPAAPAAPPAPPVAAPAARAANPPPAPAPEPVPERHPFASTPLPEPKPEFEEPFVLSMDDAEFKPLDVPVVHPPAKPVASAEPKKVVSPPPVASPAAAKPATRPVAKPAAAKPATRPVAKAAPPKAPAKAATKPAPAKPVAAKPVAAKPVAPPAKPQVAAPKIAAQVSAPALQAAAPRPAPITVTLTPSTPAAPAASAPAAKAAPEPTVQMPTLSFAPAPPQPKAAPVSATPSLSNVRKVLEELDDLSDTQTIRLLERHTPYREGSQEASVDEAIRVIKPEDAQSMAAIKSDVKRNAPVLFAVQLDWSVTPFDMAKVPPLAIFNAYTLYTTEANREGRVWYGLRLGFFSDAVSAKQVAYYVRSDFKTVSVVPVTTIEKERATDLNAERSGVHRTVNVKDTQAPTPQSIAASTSGVFKLLEDDTPEHIEQDVDGEASPRFSKPAPEKAAAKPAAAAAGAPTSKSRKPPAKGAARRDAHAQVDEETLDQTLEILGAHTLEITNDSASDTGVRHLRVKVDKKGSKFASLIDRLSGKK